MQRETYSLSPGVVVTPFDAPGNTYLVSTPLHCFRVSREVATLLQRLEAAPTSVPDLALLVPELCFRGKKSEQGLLLLFTSILLPMGIVATNGDREKVCWTPADSRTLSHDPFALNLRLPLLDVSRLDWIVRVTQKLMHPWLCAIALMLWLGSFPFLLSRLHAERLLTDPERVFSYSVSLFLILIPGRYAFGIWHELGHLSACKRHGISSNEFGVGIYWTSLVFYVGLTRSYILPRPARLLVDIGGITFTAHLSLLFLALYIATSSITCLLIASIISFDIIYNLNPLLKLDGYWILSDVLGVTNLHQRVLDSFTGRSSRTPSESRATIAYGSFLLLYLFVGVTGFLVFGLEFLTALPTFITEQWHNLGTGWSAGQMLPVLRSLWALVFTLILPLFGIGSTLWLLAAKLRRRRTKSRP